MPGRPEASSSSPASGTGPARPRPAPQRARSPLTGPALALVGIVVVAELLARAVGGHLPPLLTGDGYEMQLKAERLDELAESPAGEQPQVVFLGNSMTDAGVSPEVFTDASLRYDRAYNAALVGAPVVSQARWADRFVLDSVDPEVVVLGVSPLDLLDVNPLDLLDVTDGEGRSQAVQAAFDETLDRLDPSPWQRMEARASDLSALVRHRSSLRNPGTLGRAVADTVTGAEVREGIPQVATVEGDRVVPRDRAFWESALRPTGGTDQFHSRRLSQDRDPDLEGRLAAAAANADYKPDRLRTLLDAVDADGRTVVVAIPPIAVDTMRSEPDALPRLRQGIDLIRRVAREHGATVVDLGFAPYPLALFADVSHLNGAGSERFSRDLAHAIDDAT